MLLALLTYQVRYKKKDEAAWGGSTTVDWRPQESKPKANTYEELLECVKNLMLSHNGSQSNSFDYEYKDYNLKWGEVTDEFNLRLTVETTKPVSTLEI